MISLTTLSLFSLAALALTAAPGPDMLLICSRTISQGRQAGFATLLGIQTGTYGHALATAVGLSQLLLLLPITYDLIRITGAAYLLYLAWQTLRRKSACPDNLQAKARYNNRRLFQQGLVSNLLNPKMALFVLALFPQFMDPRAGSIFWQTLALATVLNFLGLIVNSCVIFSAHTLSSRLKRNDSQHWPNYLLASVFSLLAIRLLSASRTN